MIIIASARLESSVYVRVRSLEFDVRRVSAFGVADHTLMSADLYADRGTPWEDSLIEKLRQLHEAVDEDE